METKRSHLLSKCYSCMIAVIRGLWFQYLRHLLQFGLRFFTTGNTRTNNQRSFMLYFTTDSIKIGCLVTPSIHNANNLQSITLKQGIVISFSLLMISYIFVIVN